MIRKLFRGIIIAVAVVALYKLFGGDIGAAASAIFSKIVDIVMSISDWVIEQPIIKNFFK